MKSSTSTSPMEKINFRTKILSRHLNQTNPNAFSSSLHTSPCLNYTPPELSEPPFSFDTKTMREIMDGHNTQDRDWLFGLMMQSEVFNPREKGGKVFVSADYNQSMEQQREMTMKRIGYFIENGVFDGWVRGKGVEAEMRAFAFLEVVGIFDHSLALKIGAHFFLWGGEIEFFGPKRHKGCFAMTELGHGNNIRGIETITTYDSRTREFVINTPCESAQKYWIGGAANDATHAIVFSQLHIDGKNQGVHAFIAQIRDGNGSVCPNIRIADCGHKIGLNGVDNGRIWFDNVRVPRENLLNSVADVSPDGQYHSSIQDPDQRFAAFVAPLASVRVNIAVSAIYSSKISLAIAVRYALTRRAFSVTQNAPEVLLLDYPSHQRRLLPLLAKTYAMSFAAHYLKTLYVKRTPASVKTIHVVSSAFKATMTGHNMQTLRECREACGGQGVKTENRVGLLKGEYDAQSTFEGDNSVLLQQVSKVLLAEYIAAKKRKKPFKGLGLEHMNDSCPVIPSQLSSSTLRSIQFQNDMFCLRERDLLDRLAAEVSHRQSRGESKEYAFVVNYQLAEDLGRAFSDRAIFHTFVEAESSATAGPLKNVLGLLRSMYAMVTLDEDTVFLHYGYLTVDHAATVRTEVAKLCTELRPHALAFVSSFGIPDAFLSPIAFNWVEANTWSKSKY